MTHTEETLKKIDDFFDNITPEELYKLAVEKYGFNFKDKNEKSEEISGIVVETKFTLENKGEQTTYNVYYSKDRKLVDDMSMEFRRLIHGIPINKAFYRVLPRVCFIEIERQEINRIQELIITKRKEIREKWQQ